MELKPGYKQTEVGMIPEDWVPTTIGDVALKVGSGITPTGGSSVYKPSGRPFVRSQNVGWGKLLLNDLAHIDETTHQSFAATELKERDVLLNITGASIGRSAFVDDRLSGGNVNQHVCIIRVPHDHFDARYFNYFLLSNYGQSQIDSFQAGGNREGLNFGQIRSIKLPLPPTLAEQKAIAGTLSDADALIDSLEQLTDKKRLLKQGAMQDLLTGNQRLTGFEGEWEESAFSSKLRHHSGDSTLIKGKLSSTPIGGYFPGFSASGQDVWLPGYTQEGEALVVSAVGSRCGKCFRASGKWSAIANTHIVWPNREAVCIDYLMLYIHDEAFWTKGGSGQPFVKFKESFEKTIPWPTLPEQTAIAAILSDMAAEIAALEAKLAKARQVKHGMMQELLTGKTRLV